MKSKGLLKLAGSLLVAALQNAGHAEIVQRPGLAEQVAGLPEQCQGLLQMAYGLLVAALLDGNNAKSV
jgi:hypothetical protein